MIKSKNINYLNVTKRNYTTTLHNFPSFGVQKILLNGPNGSNGPNGPNGPNGQNVIFVLLLGCCSYGSSKK